MRIRQCQAQAGCRPSHLYPQPLLDRLQGLSQAVLQAFQAVVLPAPAVLR